MYNSPLLNSQNTFKYCKLKALFLSLISIKILHKTLNRMKKEMLISVFPYITENVIPDFVIRCRKVL